MEVQRVNPTVIPVPGGIYLVELVDWRSGTNLCQLELSPDGMVLDYTYGIFKGVGDCPVMFLGEQVVRAKNINQADPTHIAAKCLAGEKVVFLAKRREFTNNLAPWRSVVSYMMPNFHKWVGNE